GRPVHAQAHPVVDDAAHPVQTSVPGEPGRSAVVLHDRDLRPVVTDHVSPSSLTRRTPARGTLRAPDGPGRGEERPPFRAGVPILAKIGAPGELFPGIGHPPV